MAVPLQYPKYFSRVTLCSPNPAAVEAVSPLLPIDWHCTTSDPIWHLLPSDALCLIQGSPNFLADIPWSSIVAPVLFSEDLSATSQRAVWNSPSPLQVFRFTDYGGIVFNSWSCSSLRVFLPKVLQLRLPPISNLRAIHFLSSSTRGGSFVPATFTPNYGVRLQHDSGSPWICSLSCWDPKGFITVETACDKYCCPSVFSPSKRTIRSLSTLELGSMMHVPQSMLKALPASLGYPFIYALPGSLAVTIWENSNLFLHHAVRQTTYECLAESARGRSNEVLKDSPPAMETQTSYINGSTSLSSYGHNNFDFSRAVKADDAATPTFLWDDRVWSLKYHDTKRKEEFREHYPSSDVLETIRNFLLRRWRKNVWRSFRTYMRSIHGDTWYRSGAGIELTVGQDALYRAAGANWWEWCVGSTLFFWRWPPYARELVLIGHPPWFVTDPPQHKVPQRWEPDSEVRTRIKTKLEVPVLRKYIAPGLVKSLTSFFSVPKGENDLRMVYDATKSGLNACLWVPSFQLPQSETLTDLLTTSSWMADIDLGEHFHNFPLHPDLQSHCGIDVRPYFDELGHRNKAKKTKWLRWCRCMMGLKLSPYATIKATHLGFEVANGNRNDPKNALQWESVKLNFPGSLDYDPTHPWVLRTTCQGKPAGATPAYVDDLRPVGNSCDHCFQVAHQTASRLGYLGIQNASRKTRPPSQHPGAWAGIIAHSDDKGIFITTSQEKWDKAKSIVQRLQTTLTQTDFLHHKTLEQHRGFLVHLQRVFPVIAPYLKGIHLTLDGWRANRDDEGWRMALDPGAELDVSHPNAPVEVQAVSRLTTDLEALATLFNSSHPPLRPIRPTAVTTVIYGFADASGVGFGSSLQLPTGSIAYRYGLWGKDAEDASSNYRELRNLVESLEAAHHAGQLTHREIFMFTDNSTAEGSYYKGNSPSRLLFELVLRLRELELLGGLILHVIHVAGARMISQGTDGLSRGDCSSGIMGGQHMITFVPLHLSGVDRSPTLLHWIQSWAPMPTVRPLLPFEWFTKGHGLEGGSYNPDQMWIPAESCDKWYLWSPAPAAGATVLQEMSISRHKRTQLGHIFVCPRLLTQKWRRKLHSVADCVIEIPAGCRPFWPADMFEPLILGLTLPFSSTPPWQLRGSKRLLALERQLREVWEDPSRDERPILRQFCSLT